MTKGRIKLDPLVNQLVLPGNDHIISDSSDITEDPNGKTKRIIATAVLVKSATGAPETTAGRFLFDASGKEIIEVASNVTSPGADATSEVQYIELKRIHWIQNAGETTPSHQQPSNYLTGF